MEAIISQVQALAKNASEQTRKNILTALRDVGQAIETPDDTVTRLWGGHLNLAVIRIGINMGLFERLDESQKPQTVQQLASATKSDETLCARILRYLAGQGLISETDCDTFAANNATKTLASKGNQGCIKHYFDLVGPVYQEMPAFFEKAGYRNPTDAFHTVFQNAWNTKQNCFEFIMARPTNFDNFNQYMASRREDQVTWIQLYPVKEDATALTPDRPLFVDVGGGIGHQAAEFQSKYSDLPGKVINQDLPFSIDRALKTEGVENQALDFFSGQPVKNAKFYYLRAVLHDWPDEKCRTILKHTIEAMGPDSIILIDDIVAPNKGVPWQVTQVDLTMMAAGASMERTEAMWDDLFNSVGLKIHRRLIYTPGMYETVTAVVRK